MHGRDLARYYTVGRGISGFVPNLPLTLGYYNYSLYRDLIIDVSFSTLFLGRVAGPITGSLASGESGGALQIAHTYHAGDFSGIIKPMQSDLVHGRVSI